MARNMFDLLGAEELVVAGSKINLTVLPGNIDRLGLDQAKLPINQTRIIKELNPVTINDLSSSVYPKVLTLDVGGRKFKVSAHILREESGLFRHQLSDSFTWTSEADGSYFIDANPALFEHLLDFMRRPNIFPLFWTKSNGFDYNLYHRLQAEAQYFQIDALHQWIKDKRYLKAIALSVSRPTVHEVYDMECSTIRNDVDNQWHVSSGSRKTFVCPRGLEKHRGDPDACGKKCHQVRGDCEPEYVDESFIDVVTITKEVLFNEMVCEIP